MNFLGKGFRKVEHADRQRDTQTHRHIDRCGRKHYQTAFMGDKWKYHRATVMP